jgi:hypothetical protein
MTLAKRHQQAVYAAAQVTNRYGAAAGAAAGGLMGVMNSGGYAAGGAQGGYATANSSTWTDITNTSFTVVISRTTFFLYLVFATGHISAGAGKGFFRGNIVTFDTTASPYVSSAASENGFIWYGPQITGPIQPGSYTVKMQAATDAATTITIDQFFHQFLILGA